MGCECVRTRINEEDSLGADCKPLEWGHGRSGYSAIGAYQPDSIPLIGYRSCSTNFLN